jgi:biopolymer transport protein ExbD
MRRVSQRQGLVTLSEINITPLLDLAFVLLIIFVITTPLLEQGLDLRLPDGGMPDKPIEKSDIATVEVSPQGIYALKGQVMRMADIESWLNHQHRTNPRLVVYIRADGEGAFKHVAAILDSCERLGITRLSLRTKPSSGSR